MTNIVVDPSFELGTADWRCTRGPTVGTISHDAVVFHTGAFACRMTHVPAVDTGTFNIRQNTTRYPAAGGQMWHASSWVYQHTGATRSMSMSIVRVDGTGAETFTVGPAVNVAVDTWTQLTVPLTALPAGTATVFLQITGGSAVDPAEYFVIDDVYLAQGATMEVISGASLYGYGTWIFYTRTDPAAPEGTAFTWRPYGTTGFRNATLGNGGATSVNEVVMLTAGPKTAETNVPGWGTDTTVWTMPQLVYDAFTVTGQSLFINARFAFTGGGPAGSAASIDWGDGSPVQSLTHTIPDTGTVESNHLYPVTIDPVTYTTVLTSGPQSVTRDVLISGGTRSAITTADGMQRVFIDIQEWPQFDFPRASAVLPVQGREEPIVLTDVVRLPSTLITFVARTTEEGQQLLQILKYQGKLNVASPCPGVETVWIVVLGFERIRLTNRGTDVRRLFTVEAQQVSAP